MQLPELKKKYLRYENFTEQRMDDQSAEVLYRFVLPVPRVEPATVRNQENAAALPAGRKGPAQTGSGKVGRNDPCPCGSGKKYKKCCAA